MGKGIHKRGSEGGIVGGCGGTTVGDESCIGGRTNKINQQERREKKYI